MYCVGSFQCKHVYCFHSLNYKYSITQLPAQEVMSSFTFIFTLLTTSWIVMLGLSVRKEEFINGVGERREGEDGYVKGDHA